MATREGKDRKRRRMPNIAVPEVRADSSFLPKSARDTSKTKDGSDHKMTYSCSISYSTAA